MPQLPQRLRLDLPDTFASHCERLADFFEGVLAAVFETEPHLDDLLFARRQRAQHLRSLVFQVDVDHRFRRRDYAAVLDEVAQVRILLFADRRFEGDRFLRDLQDLADLGDRNVHALGDFFRRRFASQLLHQLPRSADQLVDRFDHVHRDTNRTRLVSNGTGDRLPNPPRGVGRELVATPVLELVHGFHQADVAFLNQVEELQSAVGVLFGDRDDQAEVGFDELALGVLGVHVALDDLALGALEFQEQHARFLLELLHFRADGAGLALVFLLLVLAARGVGFALQVLRLAVERTHAVNGLIDPLDQPLALVVGEAEVAHRERNAHDAPPQSHPLFAMVLGTLLLRYRRELLLQLPGL